MTDEEIINEMAKALMRHFNAAGKEEGSVLFEPAARAAFAATIRALTAERDEAKADVERQRQLVLNERDEWAASNACVSRQANEIDTLSAELVKAQARIVELEEGLRQASEMSEALPELNMSNYDINDVSALNSGSVELCLYLMYLRTLQPTRGPIP